ncbi:LysM peptidoglycan-binding domain-containing protein [Microbacterium sp. A82]|uniref:LysM peptidoglycan-binding domain-containing protein n=1 Tax=Microbacterium sp. A82 TaxID=3450452 RepID=UPI003F36823C
MRLQTERHRTRYAQIGVPAAVLGVLATAFSAAPATAATTSFDTGSHHRLTVVPKPIPMAAAPTSYVVQSGDTVSAIAAKFALRTVDVLTWNDLSWRSVIYPGQTLSLTGSAPVATPTPAPAPAPAAVTHTVVAGDTIFAIAQKYDTSVDAVLAANGLSRASVIYPGQVITISGAAAPAPAPAPAPAAVPPAAPGSAASTHAVAPGDTLFAIAQKHGISLDELYRLNGLGPASIIYPGESIIVATPAPAPAPAAPAPAATGPQTAALDTPQAENAALIISIGRELGVSDRGIAIALATSMVESWLRNLDWGDRDSLGLFQQRPSTGWGTPEQIMNRDRSIRVFFGGASDPNGQTTRGLLDIAGWESMRFTDAAQAVQISAYPERYGAWEAQAYEWIALHG